MARRIARKDRGQIEAKAIDVHFLTQYRRLSTIIRRTIGWLALSVLPQPV